MNTKRRQDTEKIRRAMLAKVHIAKKELGMDDAVYRVILQDEFGVDSSARLSIGELERLVGRFESKGWKSQKTTADRRPRTAENKQQQWQVEALKERIGQEVANSDLTELRFRGLVRKICGVDDLQWCGDAVRLKQLLAVIGRMKDAGEISHRPTQTRGQKNET
jgi:transposase